LAPAPERGKKLPWKDFIRSHTEVLAAVDFFTAEVCVAGGLMTYYVLVYMRLASRQVCIADSTLCPDGEWMKRMARNITMAEDGQGGRFTNSDWGEVVNREDCQALLLLIGRI
jgi:putative transposase